MLRVLKRALIFLHRWIGVVLAAVFMLWFASGIVMMYWTYPRVEELDRLTHAPVLRPSLIRIGVEEAYAKLGREEPPAQVILTTFDGRPVYRFDGGQPGDGDDAAMVYADDGRVQRVIEQSMLDRAASQWAGRPLGEAARSTLSSIDQWTIGLRTEWPVYKYAWNDGQQVYVDPGKAAVVQYTTPASRFWAYAGAIPHWLYFTPLRRDAQRWSLLVIWLAAIGGAASFSGLLIGIWMLSPGRRYRQGGVPTRVPYRGWKRWHMVIGLVAGAAAFTWVLSGLLSMGPFETVDRLVEWTIPSEVSGPAGDAGPQAAVRIVETFAASAPLTLAAFAARPPAAALASVSGFDVKELSWVSFDDKPAYLATNGRGDTRMIPIDGESRSSFAIADVQRLARAAAGPALAELRVIHEYDAYYLDRKGERPLPVILVRLSDAASSRYYIDPKTASMVGSYSSRGWVDRWLYHGLHSFDFPWLYNHRPLWDIVVITLLLGGNALCITSFVLAWRVLMRKLGTLTGARRAMPADDLVLDAEP